MNISTHRYLARIFAVLFLLGGVSVAQAYDDVDIDHFYTELAPYGTWVSHPQYQRVWYPHNVPRGWRPYTHGHWANTYEHGWTWVSDWEWGWAPFHYGRWFHDSHYGWVWVPGTVWGPGWVAWRNGNGYIGWGPLPPSVGWDDRDGLISSDVDISFGLATDHWIFISDQYFVTPHVHRYVYLPPRNHYFFSITSHVTHYSYRDRHIYNNCLPVSHIELVTRHSVPITRIRETDHSRSWRAHRHNADELVVYRPRWRNEREYRDHHDHTRREWFGHSSGQGYESFQGNPRIFRQAEPVNRGDDRHREEYRNHRDDDRHRGEYRNHRDDDRHRRDYRDQNQDRNTSNSSNSGVVGNPQIFRQPDKVDMHRQQEQPIKPYRNEQRPEHRTRDSNSTVIQGNPQIIRSDNSGSSGRSEPPRQDRQHDRPPHKEERKQARDERKEFRESERQDRQERREQKHYERHDRDKRRD